MKTILRLYYAIKDKVKEVTSKNVCGKRDIVVKVFNECVALPTVYRPKTTVLDFDDAITLIELWQLKQSNESMVVIGKSGSGKTLLGLSMQASDPMTTYWQCDLSKYPDRDIEDCHTLIVDEVAKLSAHQIQWLSTLQSSGLNIVLLCLDKRDIPCLINQSKYDNMELRFERSTQTCFIDSQALHHAMSN